MPRLTDARRRDRREQIASAALHCFAERGFANTSMADIIKESGLSAGSIYSHFASKADLMLFVAAGVLESRIRDLAPGATPVDLLRTVLGQVHPERMNLLVQVWAEAARDSELASLVQENVAAILKVVTAMLGRGNGSRPSQSGCDGEAPSVPSAGAVLCAMQGYIVRVALDPTVDHEALLTDLADMLGR